MTTVRLGVIAQRCALMFGIAALIGACGDSGSKGLGNSGGGAGTGGTTDGGPGDSGNFQVLDAYVLPRRDLGRDTDGGLGTFRDSCQDNLDCQSGWCVPFEDHNVCSQQCLDQGCPDGWSCHAVANTDPDVVFICFPPGNRLCGVCLQDADCPHGHCFALDGLNVCGVDCESDDTCPKDYACKTVSDDPATPKQCAPKTNSCTCDVKHDGDERVCEKAGAVGTCYGRETCDPTAGWTGCSAPDPKPEVCNQQDDDCNGLTDDIEGLGGPCERTVDVGGAQRSCAGRLICTRESETPTCTASEPRAELCNYLDDDCNGDTDETFPERGAICEVGQGVCRRVGVTECTDDGSGTRCNVVEGQPEAEKCDGLDNDCDGQTDEDFEGVNDPCFNGVGACRRAAALRCNADGSGVECPAVPGQPTPEICDGLDNNCDGTTDEGFDGLFEPCDDGVGACRRTGFRYCTEDGQHVACTAAASQPSPELCNGVDDDCDGQTDEDFPNVNTVCTNGEGFCQRAGVNVCAPDGHGTICTAPNSDPQPERCDGLDNDCDGQIDEDFADLDTICTAGDGACQRVGIVVCSADGAQAVCSAVAAVPQPEICNGLDDNCDGRVDEGFADLARPCSAGEGACLSFGVNRCSADGQSVVCDATPGDPVDEICDNVDNDCDGQTDEDFDGIDAPCATGIGACARAGLGACSDDGASVVCNAVAGQPSPELCNGLDDNCDGRVDEAFPALNERCESGRGECHRVGIQTCSADGHGTTCTVGAADPRAEICDGLDNDCDGVVDNGFAGINTPCTVGQGECTRIGVRSCSADGQSVVCNAEAGPVAPETCDGRDNNCDGRVDESFPDVNTPCHAGQGACLRYGVFGCSADGSGTACSASPGAPSPDVCDGIDNNCDGRTDENNANLGTTCSKGLGACRRSGVFVCDPANAAGPTLCDADTVAPASPTEACDYQDDNCDGVVDDGFVDAQGRYTTLGDCGSCNNDCNALWGNNPESFGVAPRCGLAGNVAQCQFTCLPGFLDADRVPNNGCELQIDAGCIYVSTPANGGADVANCGTVQQPCATVGNGIVRAVDAGRSRVRVSDGVYHESVTLSNGVSVLGGHHRTTWARDPALNVTIINGHTLAGIHRKAVIAVGINRATVLDGFVINGESPLTEGNSYAVYVRDSDNNLAITNNRIFAGDGGRGANGVNGNPGQTGVAGGVGRVSFNTLANLATCTPDPGAAIVRNAGGLGGALACGGVSVSGGAGGGAVCPLKERHEKNGAVGILNPAPPAPPAPPSVGTGGTGAWGMNGTTVIVGVNVNKTCIVSNAGPADAFPGGLGGSGRDGAGGAGAPAGSGTVLADNEWGGPSGSAGVAATPGAGGGGGGAAAGVYDTYTLSSDVGASGGGGGSGGCQGTAGAGGASGGGSFGVFITFTGAGPAVGAGFPVLTDNEISRGFGGSGGDGGNGAPGGEGGNGALGGGTGAGLLYGFCSFQGGGGGKGGRGGHGAGGGGGMGGASFDIVVNNENGLAPNYTATNNFDVANNVATGGTSGSGGGSLVPTGIGANGGVGLSGNLLRVP